MARHLFVALILLCLPPAASAQYPEGRREVVTDEPRLGDVVANAPLPAHMHIRNEGGRDGAGLCVICSILLNGRYQGVPGLDAGKLSDLWLAAKADDGGYYPGKLEALLKRLYPDEKWISWEGESTELLEHYSSQGYPLGQTINTAELYQGQPIHHMVSNGHVDAKLAMYVDNNDPEKYHWITREELDRRFPDGAKGWCFVWLRKPNSDELLFASAAILLLASPPILAAARASRPRLAV